MSIPPDHIKTFLEKDQMNINDSSCGVPISHLNRPINGALKPLMDRTIIATKDSYIDSSSFLYEYKVIEPTNQQLDRLIASLQELHDLPSGTTLLNTLSNLLETKDKSLGFSFILDNDASPACKGVYITICDANGVKEKEPSSTFIKLPESLPSSIRLPFYSKNQQKIVYVDEPISVVIAHELIHCVQNLSYRNVSADILTELRREDSPIKCLGEENGDLFTWCQDFFAGTDPVTWPDELQAMVLGFRIGTDYVSESQLLKELLNEGRCPHALAQYKNDVLIPFGHLAPDEKPADNDLLNFTTLLSQTKLTLFEGIQPSPPKNHCIIQ